MSVPQCKTICSDCGRTVRYHRKLLGRNVQCPNCGVTLKLNDTLADAATESAQNSQAATTTVEGKSPPTMIIKGSDGRRTSQPRSNENTKRIGRFELVRRIGHGGFGEVWEAQDLHLGRQVAIKLPLFPASEKKKIARFLTEGRAAAQLRHPNIVGVFDAGVVDSRHYLAIELVTGKSLYEFAQNKRLTHAQAAQVIAKLAEALHYAHTQGIVHRDIKPQNIVINEHLEPQILDFGLAKILDDDAGLTMDGAVLGTPAFMAPEQARGDTASIGPLSDQYSLGATLYWLLTGRPPFEGPHALVLAQVANATPPSPSHLLDTKIDARLEAICLKSIAKIPSDRYRDCQEMAKDLQRYMRDEVILARPIGPVGRAIRWAIRNRVDASLLAVAAMVLCASFSLSFSGYRQAATLTKVALNSEEQAALRLFELEATQARMQEELRRLTTAKQRSEQARRDESTAQSQSEAAQIALQQKIAENESVAEQVQAQIALIKINQAYETQVSGEIESAITSQHAEQEILPDPLLFVQLDSLLKEASALIAEGQLDHARQTLERIAPKFRDWRWQFFTSSLTASWISTIRSLPKGFKAYRVDSQNRVIVFYSYAKNPIECRLVDLDSGEEVFKCGVLNLYSMAYHRPSKSIAYLENGRGNSKITVRAPSEAVRSFQLPFFLPFLFFAESGQLYGVGTKPSQTMDYGAVVVRLGDDPQIVWDIANDSLFDAELAKVRRTIKDVDGMKRASGQQSHHSGITYAIMATGDSSRFFLSYSDSRLGHDLLISLSISGEGVTLKNLWHMEGSQTMPTAAFKKYERGSLNGRPLTADLALEKLVGDASPKIQLMYPTQLTGSRGFIEFAAENGKLFASSFENNLRYRQNANSVFPQYLGYNTGETTRMIPLCSLPKNFAADQALSVAIDLSADYLVVSGATHYAVLKNPRLPNEPPMKADDRGNSK